MKKVNALLISGWGTSAAVWDPIIPVLEQAYQIDVIEPPWLPAGQALGSMSAVDDYIESLAQRMSEDTTLIAWSLGGLLALRLAVRFPNKAKRLVLIASTAYFPCDQGGVNGIDRSWLNSFCERFKSAPEKTLQRFMTLQVKGEQQAKPCLRLLQQLCTVSEYDMDECEAGLMLLSTLDVRDELTQVVQPVRIIHGQNDAVLPVAAGKHLAAVLHSHCHIIADAGHVPQLSHSAAVAEAICQPWTESLSHYSKN